MQPPGVNSASSNVVGQNAENNPNLAQGMFDHSREQGASYDDTMADQDDVAIVDQDSHHQSPLGHIPGNTIEVASPVIAARDCSV